MSRITCRVLVAGLALAAACAGPVATASADRPFAARYQTHSRGDLARAGNTLLSCPAAEAGCDTVQAGAGGNRQNNNWTMAWVDADSDADTFNSSTATLSLPAGASVTFAALYWGADTVAGAGGAPAGAPTFAATALLDTPAAGGYAPVTGSLQDLAGGLWPGRYQTFADVTGEVQAAGAGDYTLANVQASTGTDRYAGWTLIVAYRAPGEPIRNVTVYDGLVTVEGTASSSLTLDDFETPAAGTVQGSLGFVTYEGDFGITGDGAALNGTTLTDALNPASNFFNSTIAVQGTRVSAKSPDYVDQLGFDSDVIGVDGLIPAGATSADLLLSTSGDTYFVGVLTLVTDQVPEVPSNDALPTLSGTATDGETLSADPGAWSGTEPMAFEYQWQRCDGAGANCADIPGATGSTYELGDDDAGHTVRVEVTASNEEGSQSALSDPSAVVAGVAPTASTPPAVSGTAADGETLSADPGTWDGTGPIDYEYQWQRCDAAGDNCVDIPGASGPTYELDEDDVGHAVRVEVTATNEEGSQQALSAPSGVVVAVAPSVSVPPALSGTAADGETLTADPGAWDGTGPIDFGYQWQRCDGAGANCVDIPGATGSTYELGDDDVGHTVRVEVTATNDEGSATQTSDPSVVVVAVAPSNDALPALSGTAADGETLTADHGVWDGTGPLDFGYQWQRCDATGDNCVAIGGATGSTYELGDADVGQTVRVEVTATNAEGSATQASDPSAVVAAVAPSASTPPTLSGTARAGETLAADPGVWSGTGPFEYDYRWQRCDAAGDNCVDIPGATGSTYVPTGADVGSTVRVVVTVTNPADSATQTSAPSAPVLVQAEGPAGGSGAGNGSGGGSSGSDDDSAADDGSGPREGSSPREGSADGNGAGLGPDLRLASLPGSLVAPDKCQQVTGSQVLAFQVPGPMRFRIRVGPNGQITDERPLLARSPVKRVDQLKLNRRVRRVVYKLGGRRIAVRRRAPYAVTIGPALLRRASRQTLTVRVVPKRGKPRIARVQLNSAPCSEVFSVVHRPSPARSLLGLRIDSVTPLTGVVFRVPRRLLSAPGTRGAAGKLRVRLAGSRPRTYRLRFPRRPGRAATLLAGAGRPTVAVARGKITVSGLPAATGGIRLRLRARGMVVTPRVTLRALVQGEGGARRLKQRLGRARR